MTTLTLKSELASIAKRLTSKSTYEDVMYELYVRMKISQGRQAADRGQVISHDEVKQRFFR